MTLARLLLPLALLASPACAQPAPTVTDGDTIRIGDERIRLLGIDAPELPGHCRQGRNCAPGDPVASKRALAVAMSRGPVEVERFGTDRYGRTLAIVRVRGVNLSCQQVVTGHAIYVARWDNGGRVRAECPAVAQ